MEGDAVLGFRLSASHGSILPVTSKIVCQNIRANKPIIVMAIAILMCLRMDSSISFLLEGMEKGYELGANHLCDAVHTSPLCRILQCDLRHKGLGQKLVGSNPSFAAFDAERNGSFSCANSLLLLRQP